MTALSTPLLPASYDVVWTLVVVALLGAVVLGVLLVVRTVRRAKAPSAVRKVESLATLRESGAISEQEYEDRKNRVLDRF